MKRLMMMNGRIIGRLDEDDHRSVRATAPPRRPGEHLQPLVAPGEHWPLGGQQAKFILRWSDDQWVEATGSEATTHIFKPGIFALRSQALIEHLSLRSLAFTRALAPADSLFPAIAHALRGNGSDRHHPLRPIHRVRRSFLPSSPRGSAPVDLNPAALQVRGHGPRCRVRSPENRCCRRADRSLHTGRPPQLDPRRA